MDNMVGKKRKLLNVYNYIISHCQFPTRHYTVIYLFYIVRMCIFKLRLYGASPPPNKQFHFIAIASSKFAEKNSRFCT